MRVLGVDPGKTGAIALLQDGHLMDVVDTPETDGALAQLVAGWLPIDLAIVENVHSMPGQGVASTFNFGVSLGVVKGVLATLQVPIDWVTPTAWKKLHGIPTGKNVTKAEQKRRAIRRATEKWPEMGHLFARVKDADRAEAALIAAWGMGS